MLCWAHPSSIDFSSVANLDDYYYDPTLNYLVNYSVIALAYSIVVLTGELNASDWPRVIG